MIKLKDEIILVRTRSGDKAWLCVILRQHDAIACMNIFAYYFHTIPNFQRNTKLPYIFKE